MTEKQKIALAFGVGFAIIGVTALLIARRKRNVGKTPFRRRAVKIAKQEYKKFQEGKLKETSPQVYDELKKYWDELNWSEDRWSPTGVAWSSAFISYVMKKARAKDDFGYGSSHSDYIVPAIKNRKENNSNKFKGYRLNEKKVEIGDLVCYARQDGVNYDTKGQYKSHCDIITEIDDNYAYGIGGNVSDSVTKSKIPIKNGYVQEGNKRFVVIKTK